MIANNETKHTPGPWTVIKSNDKSKYAVNWLEISPGVVSSSEYSTSRWGESETYCGVRITEANARLIAAAPDLLAVARQIEWLATAGEDRDGVPYQPTASDWMRLWSQARDAIAKAEGRA